MQEECPGKVTGFIVKCWFSLLVCDRWDGDGKYTCGPMSNAAAATARICVQTTSRSFPTLKHSSISPFWPINVANQSNLSATYASGWHRKEIEIFP